MEEMPMVMAVARIEKVFGWFQKELGLKTIIHDFLMKLCLFIMGRGEKKAITAVKLHLTTESYSVKVVFKKVLYYY